MPVQEQELTELYLTVDYSAGTMQLTLLTNPGRDAATFPYVQKLFQLLVTWAHGLTVIALLKDFTISCVSLPPHCTCTCVGTSSRTDELEVLQTNISIQNESIHHFCEEPPPPICPLKGHQHLARMYPNGKPESTPLKVSPQELTVCVAAGGKSAEVQGHTGCYEKHVLRPRSSTLQGHVPGRFRRSTDEATERRQLVCCRHRQLRPR